MCLWFCSKHSFVFILIPLFMDLSIWFLFLIFKFLLEYSWFQIMFCCIAKWISYTYTFIYSFLDLFPHRTLLSIEKHSSLFVIYFILYIVVCICQSKLPVCPSPTPVPLVCIYTALGSCAYQTSVRRCRKYSSRGRHLLSNGSKLFSFTWIISPSISLTNPLPPVPPSSGSLESNPLLSATTSL